MSSDGIKISLGIARTICQMEALCSGEGFGTDNDELLYWIFSTYGELLEEFSHLWCSKYFSIEDEGYRKYRKDLKRKTEEHRAKMVKRYPKSFEKGTLFAEEGRL